MKCTHYQKCVLTQVLILTKLQCNRYTICMHFTATVVNIVRCLLKVDFNVLRSPSVTELKTAIKQLFEG